MFFIWYNCLRFKYRSEDTRIQSDDLPSISDIIPTNHSFLYNSMIYPFTRSAIYGVIWYQGK